MGRKARELIQYIKNLTLLPPLHRYKTRIRIRQNGTPQLHRNGKKHESPGIRQGSACLRLEVGSGVEPL